MNFFEKLKKMFGEEKKKSVVRINEGEILNWFGGKEEEDKEILSEKLISFYEELGGVLKEIEAAIGVLRGVDISERKIEDRYKVITEVGKKDYISALEELISGLGERKEGDFSLEHIRGELNKFLKVEVKAKFKATQLIGKEVGAIDNLVSSIKRRVNKFLNENETFFLKRKEIKHLGAAFGLINKNKYEKDKLAKKIYEFEEEVKSSKNRIEEIDGEIERIKESPEFSNEKELKSLKETKNQEIASIDSEIKILLDKSLFEKELYLEEDKKKANFIKKYLSEPISSLMEDERMEIIDYIKKIKEGESGTIVLKESKLKKLQEGIDSLEKLKTRRKELGKNIEELEKSIGETISEKEIHSLEQEKSQKEQEINEREHLIEKIKEKKKTLEEKIISLKNEFEEQMKENNEVEIAWKV